MAKNQVTLTFAGDDKPLKRALDDVGDSTDRMVRRVDHAGTRMQRAGIDVQQLGGHLFSMAKIAGAAAVAVGAAMVVIGRASVEAFVEADTQQRKLEDAYKRFPAIASVNIEALRKLATERMKVTRFDDDATAAAAAQLAQFKLTGKQIVTLIPLVQDFAAKTGKDLPDAATTLGNALLGKGRALAEIGIKFKDAGSVTKNYAQLVAILRQQVGGFAEEEGRSAAGSLEILKNRFGEVQEAIGSRLLPVLSEAVGGLADLAEIGGEKFDDLVSNVDGLSLESLPKLQGAFTEVGDQIRGQLGESFNELKDFVKDNREEIERFIGQVAGFVKDSGPALKLMIDLLAISFQMGARNVMMLVDGLDRLKDWYTRNIGWLAPWVNIMNRFTGGGPVSSAGERRTASQSMGPIPKFHSGGTMPGVPGSEGLAILQAGENVSQPGQGGTTVIELRSLGSGFWDHMLLEMLKRALGGRNIQVALDGG